ncbi:hypothetical protein [Teredinibacter sp. KSP-S5-2]|uniref:hypothetical protein n=1 Tax=Teredinibacter sp. KSP-S5-2 TaxID=3034506 RepID=UPI0029346BF5|nr:hypothetical protein [Teredinibacter sp. KSP-S5-2]WNO08452.1 hypothetical protein P5V12_15890 [Teredinibacter sp. KSP-S5-2]
MMRFNPKSPKKVNGSVKNIIRHLDLNENEVVLLKYFRPSEFSPEIHNCFFNTWVKMKCAGGDMQHGWMISQDSTKEFIEAQFHAVWINSEGAFIDVTPRPDNEKRVMFVPDHNRKIELSQSNGQPAILSYDNFRMLNGQALAKLERIRVVMHDTNFIKEHALSWL